MVRMLLAGRPCQVALACGYYNITIHVGGASFQKCGIVAMHPSKTMTATICKIFFVGREGYMKSKMIIQFGAMFFSFVRLLDTALRGNLHIYSV